MTLKYESEILIDLMKRDGDDAPSDVLPYESELKEKYLEQVEGAYPKLQDYRPEWLYYNLYHHLPSDFPVESVANVTNATFENVVPYAYKSAILKGQTLVNLIRTIGKTFLEQYQDAVSLIHVKPSTKYLLKIKNNTSEAKSFYSSEITEWTQIDIEANQTITKTLTTKSILGRNTLLQNLKTHTTEHDLSIIFIEYQDGMENWDIPYFEGMQSVKMPVLTTTGKNLFDIKNIDKFYELTNNVTNKYKIRLKPNTNYTMSSNVPHTATANIYFNGTKTDVNGVYINAPKTAMSDNDGNLIFYIRVDNGTGINLENFINNDYYIQLEEGYNATSYEPFKSNILTVNEDVTLRGIGDVQDKLDYLTGEVTESIGEIVLDGTQYMVSDGYGVYIQANDVKRFLDYTDKIACDKLPVIPTYRELENVENGISGFTNSGSYLGQNWLYVKINNSVNTDEVKEWLTQKPITVQYQLAQESIKTVDLTVTDQDGKTASIIRPIEGTMHVNTSSQTLTPLLDMSVPVEATTQNLMSFANIKEEE